jgi:AraC family transcriptional regulator
LAKIAVGLEQALSRRAASGAVGSTTRRIVAAGDGWEVSDVLCTCGSLDRPFEEQHSRFSIAIVLEGTFRYRSESRRGVRNELMTPGSLFLGNPGQCFECGHEHGAGDRCLSFQFEPEYFERLVADAGVAKAVFPVLRLPSERQLSPLVTKASAKLAAPAGGAVALWEELGIQLATQVAHVAIGSRQATEAASPSAVRGVARAVRWIERHSDSELKLGELARVAGLSPYHFLRTFQQITGVTPHQYVRRIRLRFAAIRLATEPAKVLDVALDCGFGDVSNFNRAFREEFGASPRSYRLQCGASTQRSQSPRLPHVF